MKVSKGLLWTAVLMIIATGIIHLVRAPHKFEEATYVGILFVANAIGAAVSALGIYLQRMWAWHLGALIAAGAFIGFILSRTAGLPVMGEEEWNAVGILSLVVEGLFLLVYALVLMNPDRRAE